MRGERIAVLSMACRFPEAATPTAFWNNILAGRRSFRSIPKERLDLSEYARENVGPADEIPNILAGLITDWEFDRAAHRIPLATFEVTDLTHWLALETAAQAIADIGGADVIPRDRTIVVIGDTLTGEFTRSSQLRLRLPYLMRRLEGVLEGLKPEARTDILTDFATSIREDFPDPNEESLAGALANTISGRIANYFDLRGGCWTVDGACASSLLSVVDACGRLSDGSADMAVVGGVDLSLDPFELVGFARAGALAKDTMSVFDKRASGFWPGEGCGIAILASAATARSLGVDPLAWIDGWGVSSDGAGGLTRPTHGGQLRALQSAWRAAELDPAKAGYFEAHGTGTAVGDPTEIVALAQLVGDVDQCIPVGSVKGNIGHCKAAAGAAGLIKAIHAVQEGIVPPHVGAQVPNPAFEESGARLVPSELSVMETSHTAGVSGFGFGGINAHVVVSATEQKSAPILPRPAIIQDAEVFVFAGATLEDLLGKVARLRERAGSFSLGEMTDAAATCARESANPGPWRTAIVASRPEELAASLAQIESDPENRVQSIEVSPRVGLILPGQAAPVRRFAGAWHRRFTKESKILRHILPQTRENDPDTRTAQPAIMASCLIGLKVLERLEVHADVAVGHSLGELAALCWAGALTPDATMELARRRGAAMADHAKDGGSMLRIPFGVERSEKLANRYGMQLACLNGASETVISGPSEHADALMTDFPDARIVRLQVSHAFHSQDMQSAIEPFSQVLENVELSMPQRRVVSTVSGLPVASAVDARRLLSEQLCAPVQFLAALEVLAEDSDVLIECGPGAGLTRLAKTAGRECVSLDVGSDSLRPLLDALARLWQLGVAFNVEALFNDRHVRELTWDAPKFLANPCGVRTSEETQFPFGIANARVPLVPEPDTLAVQGSADPTQTLMVVREAVAEVLGLPIEAVATDASLLGDLHLNSLSVGRIVVAAAGRVGVKVPATATDLGAATVADVAALLQELATHGSVEPNESTRIDGVAPWIAEYEEVWTDVGWPSGDEDEAELWRTCELSEGREEISSAGATHAVIVLPLGGARGDDKASAHNMWLRVRHLRESAVKHLAIVHAGMAVRGFARSLLAEGAFDQITLIDNSRCPENWAAVRKLLSVRRGAFSCWRIKEAETFSRLD